ncbi:MAG: hypothetical protein P4L41_00555 [Flavipsychrobacter sp.]|nr:hypothetical protein [Flavipsychrobacter sp.]
MIEIVSQKKAIGRYQNTIAFTPAFALYQPAKHIILGIVHLAIQYIAYFTVVAR